MTSIFFSYSHADEALRDRLEKGLAMLKRQGAIDTWHDRRISGQLCRSNSLRLQKNRSIQAR